MRGDPPQYKKCGNRLHSTIATQGGHRYAAAETPVMPKIHVAEWKQNFTLGPSGQNGVSVRAACAPRWGVRRRRDFVERPRFRRVTVA